MIFNLFFNKWQNISLFLDHLPTSRNQVLDKFNLHLIFFFMYLDSIYFLIFISLYSFNSTTKTYFLFHFTLSISVFGTCIYNPKVTKVVLNIFRDLGVFLLFSFRLPFLSSSKWAKCSIILSYMMGVSLEMYRAAIGLFNCCMFSICSILRVLASVISFGYHAVYMALHCWLFFFSLIVILNLTLGPEQIFLYI